MDPGGSDPELLVIGIGVSLVVVTEWQALTNLAELLQILLLDP